MRIRLLCGVPHFHFFAPSLFLLNITGNELYVGFVTFLTSKIGLILSATSTFYLAPVHPVANFLTLFANLAYAILWTVLPPATVKKTSQEKTTVTGKRP